MNDSEGRCSVFISTTGVVTSSSSCYVPGVISSTPFRGRLFYQPSCHIFGTVTTGGKTLIIDGWISKGKDSLSGMSWNTAKPTSGHVFSGVKQ